MVYSHDNIQFLQLVDELVQDISLNWRKLCSCCRNVHHFCLKKVQFELCCLDWNSPSEDILTHIYLFNLVANANHSLLYNSQVSRVGGELQELATLLLINKYHLLGTKLIQYEKMDKRTFLIMSLKHLNPVSLRIVKA